MRLEEIVILSRGGQGGVTMAKMLAYAATLMGLDAAAIPKYGAERRGAPVQSSIRISDRRIKQHAQVRQPNHVIALDKNLISRLIDPNNIHPECTFTINAKEEPELIEKYPHKRLGYVNALEIAREVNLIRSGVAILSTPMLGAFLRVIDFISLEAMEEAVKHYVTDPEFLERNLKALKAAYKAVKIIDGMKKVETATLK